MMNGDSYLPYPDWMLDGIGHKIAVGIGLLVILAEVVFICWMIFIGW